MALVQTETGLDSTKYDVGEIIGTYCRHIIVVCILKESRSRRLRHHPQSQEEKRWLREYSPVYTQS